MARALYRRLITTCNFDRLTSLTSHAVCPSLTSRNGHIPTSFDRTRTFVFTVEKPVDFGKGPPKEAEEVGLCNWDRSPACCRVPLDLIELRYAGELIALIG